MVFTMFAASPWSNNRLKLLSRHIRDGTVVPDGVPTYGDVMLWYNDVAAEVQHAIECLDWTPLLGDRPFEVTSRSKTLDTLQQKLRRDPSTPMPSVQDIAGVRFEAEMSLDEQDAIAHAVAGMYGQGASIKDLRSDPHSGYRAVHVWLRLPARVEVQIRTHMQSAWANVYEAAADVFGRDIRYGRLPDDPIERQTVIALQNLSVKAIATAEETRNSKAQELLVLSEFADSGSPLFDQQVRDRLADEWSQRREAEQSFRDELGRIQEQFRSMHGRG